MMTSDKELAAIERTLLQAAQREKLVEQNKAAARKMLEAMMLTHSMSALRSEVVKITTGRNTDGDSL